MKQILLDALLSVSGVSWFKKGLVWSGEAEGEVPSQDRSKPTVGYPPTPRTTAPASTYSSLHPLPLLLDFARCPADLSRASPYSSSRTRYIARLCGSSAQTRAHLFSVAIISHKINIILKHLDL